MTMEYIQINKLVQYHQYILYVNSFIKVRKYYFISDYEIKNLLGLNSLLFCTILQ